MKFHHVMELHKVVYGTIRSSELHCEEKSFLPAYLWLERQVGYYPLFVAVGATETDMRMTGYDNQWRRKIRWSKDGDNLRKAGEAPNYALFSWDDLDGTFTDYQYWHIPLNSCHDPDWSITPYEHKLVFKPTFDKERWLRYARRNKHCVQLIAKELDLTAAKRIWVRNKASKDYLQSLGFANIEVRKIKVG